MTLIIGGPPLYRSGINLYSDHEPQRTESQKHGCTCHWYSGSDHNKYCPIRHLGAPMPSEFTNGINFTNAGSISFPSPQQPSPKKLRKQADAIEAERKAAKKREKAHAKKVARWDADREENREIAREALLRVAADPKKGYASVEAAKALLELS